MPDVIDIDVVENLAEARGDDIEQASIEIEVAESEYRVVDHAASIVFEDQLPIMMLQALVVRYRIVVEGQQRAWGDRAKQQPGREIEAIKAAWQVRSFHTAVNLVGTDQPRARSNILAHRRPCSGLEFRQ